MSFEPILHDPDKKIVMYLGNGKFEYITHSYGQGFGDLYWGHYFTFDTENPTSKAKALQSATADFLHRTGER
jgi:hypothetical protein